jgi:hypothetical protein
MARKWLMALLVVWLASGCGPGGGAGDDSSTDTDADGSAGCVAPDEADLQGWWAVRAFIRLEMREDPLAVIHVCDDPPLSLALVTWVMQVDEPASGVASYTFRTCAIELPQVTVSFADCSLGETLIAYILTSSALDESLDDESYSGTAEITESGGCAGLRTSDLFVHIGIAEDYDWAVPLPGWDVDCTGSAVDCVPGFETDVLDTDDDGDPGATIEIDTDPPDLLEGVAWATLRHSPNIDGRLSSSALVTGDMAPQLEYDVVGSDAFMSGLPMDTPTVKRNIPDFYPLTDGSHFILVRVDGRHGAVDLTSGGEATCAAVNSASGLFE